MGGGSHRASASRPPTPRSPIRHYLPHPVIPAQAGTRANPVTPAPLLRHPRAGRNPPAHNADLAPPLPQNSSLPPFRGEVRWGVGATEPAPAALQHPDRRSAITCPTPSPPPRQEPAQAPSFLRRQEPAPPPVTPAQAGTRTSPVIPALLAVIPAQAGTRAPTPSFLRRQEPGLQPAPRHSIPAGAMHNADALPHALAARGLACRPAARAASYPPPPRDSK